MEFSLPLWKVRGDERWGVMDQPAGKQFPQSRHEGLMDCECKGLNCIPLNDAEVSTPSTYEVKWTEVKWSESRSVMSHSLQPHGLYGPWDSLSQNTGVDSLSLLQGILPNQGSNPGLPHCRWILYQLSHKRSPRILEWAAYPFSRGSSWPRNQTRVSYTTGGFFTNWAVREAPALMNITLFGNRLFADDQIKTRSLGWDLI